MCVWGVCCKALRVLEVQTAIRKLFERKNREKRRIAWRSAGDWLMRFTDNRILIGLQTVCAGELDIEKMPRIGTESILNRVPDPHPLTLDCAEWKLR